MSERRCDECIHLKSWQENGMYFDDCTVEPAASSIWRERLMHLGLDPGKYCGQYVYYDVEQYNQEQYVNESNTDASGHSVP